MPVTANTSSAIVGTGTWVLIASGGSVLSNADEKLKWAMTATTASPAETVTGHPFEHLGYGEFQHTIELTAGQHYHVFIPPGIVLHVLATDPA